MPKPFIDKKKAQHFSVVHRSQRDPLIALEDSTPNVLMPVTVGNLRKKSKSKKSKVSDENNEDFDPEALINKNALNAAEYGIFVDPKDTYDYTQHMKVMGENPDSVFIEAPSVKPKPSKGVTFNLPEEVFSSKTENPIGLMNQTSIPQEYMDDMDDELRDALIALDDEAYIEDLDDEFFDDLDDEEYQPLAGESDEELGPDATWEDHFKQFQKNKNKFDSDDDFEDEEEDEFDENGLGRFKSSRGFDSKSMASRYSMTSSAMFRNSGLTSLDEQFDRIEAEYMDDDEEEDDECPEGVPMREDFDDIMNEFLDKYEIIGKKVVTQSEGETGGDKLGILRHTLLDTGSDEAISKAKILESLEEKPKRASKESELKRPEQKVRDVWDAQSVLSTYSNIYNHPSLIKEPSKPKIVISSKGFPRLHSEQDEKLQNALSSIDEFGLDDDIDIDAHLAQLTEKINLGEARTKKETAEEKKARKAAVKEMKKNRRVEKKQTKLDYAEQKSIAQHKAAQKANQKYINLV